MGIFNEYPQLLPLIYIVIYVPRERVVLRYSGVCAYWQDWTVAVRIALLGMLTYKYPYGVARTHTLQRIQFVRGADLTACKDDCTEALFPWVQFDLFWVFWDQLRRLTWQRFECQYYKPARFTSIL